MELGRYVPARAEAMEDGSIEKTKASSEETMSIGDMNSLNRTEARNVVMNNEIKQYDDTPPRKDGAEVERNPTLHRPVARVSAFSVYNPPSRPTTGSCSKILPVQSPLIQLPRADEGACKLLDGIGCEPMVPLQCGHGCCAAESGGSHSHGSLLGPEFVDYLESPSFSSHELISIATDLNNMAWIKSGLENQHGAKVTENTANLTASQGAATTASQPGFLGQGRKNDYMQYEEGHGKFLGAMQEVLSTKMPRQHFAMPAEV